MNPCWPDQRSSQDTIKGEGRIRSALEWITTDLIRPENAATWTQLRLLEPSRTLIQIFDSTWWMYFRKIESVRASIQAASVIAQASGNDG